MSSKTVYSLMLSLFLCLFACILVSGAPRMIAAEEKRPLPAVTAARAVCLCSVKTSGAEIEIELSGKKEAPFRRMPTDEDMQISVQRVGSGNADSNGNVLLAGTYMRSVYQSFALGDGFA